MAGPAYARTEGITRFSYEQRIQRTRDLAAKYPFAAELLGFYSRVARLQAMTFEALKAAGIAADGGALKNDAIPKTATGVLLSFMVSLRELVHAHGPATLKEAADAIDGPLLLNAFWANRDAILPQERFFALALLQPYAELMGENSASSRTTGATCPLCGAEPVVAVLRPEGFGARRSLICSLCAHEWDFARALCPSCGESRPEALGVYTSEPFDHVRVEACDTCKRYIKTIDLTKDGLAVPVVDELATIPLDLWAGEQGYEKLCPSLLNL